MITPLLKLALEPILSRHRLVRMLAWSAALLAGLVIGVWVWKAAGHRVPVPALAVLAYLLGWRVPKMIAGRWEPDFTAIARQIETKHPELHAMLLTAIEQRPDPQTGRLHFLQQRVIADTLCLARAHPWIDAAPRWRVACGYAGVAIAVCALYFASKPVPKPETKRAVAAVEASKIEGVEVTPGDVEIERGTGLVVLAKFGRNAPSEATLVVQPLNAPSQRIPLVRNLDDPVFGGALTEVDAELTYRVEYAGEATRDFSVKVFEHPRLDRADATLHFPAYTSLPDKTVPDTRRVSAVEGTKLDVAFNLNKPVKSAQLVTKAEQVVPLTVDPTKPLATLSGFEITASQTYELRLVDADERANKVPTQFIIDALPNRKPELKLVTPRGDVRVSPLEEIAFRVEAWDEFGLSRFGLSYTVAGQEPKDIELGVATKADEKVPAEHLLKLEALGMKPDELVSWFVWAEDIGPDGKPRRTATDMFFAEVRPFEEIYRPGDGGEGKSQKGAGGEAMKLAEIQKQIITATWNLKRAEDGNLTTQKPAAKYLADEPVIRDSQAEALKQAKELAEKAEEPKQQEIIENVTKEMQGALDQLVAAEKTAEPLPRALAAEQSAYNALLKLAAHEFRITRNQRSKGEQSGRQQQMQAQLDELEIKDEKKRYEQQSEAEEQQDAQQREQLAILNRLKELAQRQQDINERLKELQTALQAAKTEQEKEEIRRQLKRLREEEQQLLSDIDETKQKMEQSPQQSQLAEERKQLEQTRNEAQQAAEAMERNEATQALASGTRAQRQLDELRDEFRKKTSGQFNEEMREMRREARDLAQTQQEIAEKLAAEPEKPQRRTLDGSGEREQLAKKFDEQQEKLGGITEDMKRVSEQAEAAEPLLAKELYDTLRKTAQSDTGKTLEMTKALNQRGYGEQARKFEEKARGEIEELKTGVERAAESVLGDEAEALRQARAELDTITRQLNREIAQNRPDLADNKEQADGKPQDGKQPGEQAQAGAGEQPEGKPPGQTAQEGEGKQADKAKPAEGQQSGGKQPGQMAQADERQQPGQGQPGDSKQPGEGKEPGESQPREGQQKQGEQTAQGQQRGKGQQPGQGEPPGQSGQQPGQQPGQLAQGREGQDSQPGQPGEGARGESSRDGKQPGGTQRSPSRLAEITRQRGGGNEERGIASRDGEDQAGPLTGEKFVDWSDRLRKVEEMIDDPALRTEAARVREVAKGVRAEFKRHSVAPNWEMVQSKISAPLAELRNRLAEELARRDSKENLVPIDRDPVPAQYAERVRRYYEELGRSR